MNAKKTGIDSWEDIRNKDIVNQKTDNSELSQIKKISDYSKQRNLKFTK